MKKKTSEEHAVSPRAAHPACEEPSPKHNHCTRAEGHIDDHVAMRPDGTTIERWRLTSAAAGLLKQAAPLPTTALARKRYAIAHQVGLQVARYAFDERSRKSHRNVEIHVSEDELMTLVAAGVELALHRIDTVPEYHEIIALMNEAPPDEPS